MGSQLASQQWEAEQIQVTQHNTADGLDKDSSIPSSCFPASLFFHMRLFRWQLQRLHEWNHGPDTSANYASAHAQFLSHQEDLVLQNELIVGKATLSSKREIFFFHGVMGRNSWHRQVTPQLKRCFQKHLKYSLPRSHGGEVSSSTVACRGGFARLLPTCRPVNLSTQLTEFWPIFPKPGAQRIWTRCPQYHKAVHSLEAT